MTNSKTRLIIGTIIYLGIFSFGCGNINSLFVAAKNDLLVKHSNVSGNFYIADARFGEILIGFGIDDQRNILDRHIEYKVIAYSLGSQAA